MKKIARLLVLYLVCSVTLSAQERGVSPVVSASNVQASHSTRAVVIGISDYQDPAIPDLRFAVRDAEAFSNFLGSPSGGSLDGDHLRVLVNSQATLGNVVAALDWLIDECREGDKVIVYFSGHGDVERKTISQPGYLLCWDAPGQVYMAGGAFNLRDLEEVISTLSIQNKAKVIVIADACHAGKLSGSGIGGTQIAGASLARQYANEVKILSCQPNEYSIEGEQWGGGRGVFSYHLVNGLYGMADKNGDGSVSLAEIDRYLEDEVIPEVAPVIQTPMTTGDKTTPLALVIPEMLSALKKDKDQSAMVMSQTINKGLEDLMFSGLDTAVLELYASFNQSLTDHRFFEPHDACAEYYYEKLLMEPSMAKWRNFIRRNYAAALQDNAQQIINIWLQSDVKKEDCIGESLKLEPIPKQLERAASLLGPDHYMYNSLKSRQYLFEGAALYYPKHMGSRDTLLGRQCLALYRKSLDYEPNSAIAFYRMGLSYGYHLRSLDSAAICLEEALRLVPSWLSPLTQFYWILNKTAKQPDREKAVLDRAIAIDSLHGYVLSALGTWYSERGRFEEAIETYNKYESTGAPVYRCWYHGHGKTFEKMGKFDLAETQYLKTIVLDSTNDVAYNDLGRLYQRMGRYAEAEAYLKKSLAIDTTDAIGWNNLGVLYLNTRNYAEAEHFLKKAISLDPGYTAAQSNLGILYSIIGKYAEAEAILKSALEVDPSNANGWNELGFSYSYMNLNQEAKAALLKAVALDSTQVNAWNNLGFTLLQLNELPGAEAALRQAIRLDSSFANSRKHLATVMLRLGRLEEARRELQISLELNPGYFGCYLGMAYLSLMENKNNEAIEWLEKAIQNGVHLVELQSDPDLAPLREKTDIWKALIKKHFPEQFKD